MWWTLPELAAEWGVSRQTVRYYVTQKLLKALREGEGSRFPYRVSRREKRRFEDHVQPTLKPGRNPKK